MRRVRTTPGDQPVFDGGVAAHGAARVALGALDTGAYLLAEAGLIGDQPVTLHWEAVPAFREDYPDVHVTEELFCLGDRLFTCAGGTAAIDMMLERIARRQGPTLARAVSEQFIHSRIRPHEERQRSNLAVRIGSRDPRLIAVIAQMEAEIENPLRLEDMAMGAGITRRQLERLFMAQFGEGLRPTIAISGWTARNRSWPIPACR